MKAFGAQVFDGRSKPAGDEWSPEAREAAAEARRAGSSGGGVKIPMPKDPKERADYEGAIARRKAAGGGKYVGDP